MGRDIKLVSTGAAIEGCKKESKPGYKDSVDHCPKM
jgi:hypothetical protein